jgi:hypothetical protein
MDNEAPLIVPVVATIATTFGFAVRQVLTCIRARRRLRLQANTTNRIVQRLGATPELVTPAPRKPTAVTISAALPQIWSAITSADAIAHRDSPPAFPARLLVPPSKPAAMSRARS